MLHFTYHKKNLKFKQSLEKVFNPNCLGTFYLGIASIAGLVVEFHWKGLAANCDALSIFQRHGPKDWVSHRVAISVYMYVCPLPVIFILRPLF